MNPSGVSPETEIAGPLLIFIGAAISFIGISINFAVALQEYRSGVNNPTAYPPY
ncbi:hypothetical protein ACFOZY_12820 [Chungangia koreensis]|uniref:Uncharacterized protein n=1 Tax=Chungangia koreensis TaxID=752657 RepID=A0ABV8XB09_9LACT